jgi:hypothetical protein
MFFPLYIPAGEKVGEKQVKSEKLLIISIAY